MEKILQDAVLQAIIFACTLQELYGILDLACIEIGSGTGAKGMLKTFLQRMTRRRGIAHSLQTMAI